jgi:hypothetical protein
MSKLRPIGSEKLQGDDKIARIMEIARYKENIPTPINETSSREYEITLSDGAKYFIDKEKLGYVIKKTVNESVDYVEPMKNRKHYSSYSQAFKRLNLVAKEVNRLTENEEHISLFNEDKKYFLKTPKPATPEMPEEEPDMAPPMPEPSPSPEPSNDSEENMDPNMEMGIDSDELGSDEMSPEMDGGNEDESNGDDEVSFKSIQKLTGKLSQKIRDIEEEQPLSSKDIKYVINSLLSALNLEELDEDDKDEIVSRFDGEDEDEDMSESNDESLPSDDFEADVDTEMEVNSEVGESSEGIKSSIASPMENIYGVNESKVNKILQKYFILSEDEKKENNKKYNFNLKKISELSVSKIQKNISESLIEQSPNLLFIGRSNQKNLVFENNGIRLKVSPKGRII